MYKGFPKEVFQFYKDLKENNNRRWFQANKDYYTNSLQEPAREFVKVFGERLKFEFPEIIADPRLIGGSILRVYRDVRFSKDKTPYKTNLGIVFWQGNRKRTENPSFYFHLDAETAGLYCGQWKFPKETLHIYREKIAYSEMAEELAEIEAEINANKGFELTGQRYKRVPRGYDKDHSFADYLLYKGLWVESPPFSKEVTSSTMLLDACMEYVQLMKPLFLWLLKLDKYVG